MSPLCLQLGEHCSELKDIHLGQCYSITDEGMVALAKGCPKLQRLYLQENKLVSPTHVVSYLYFTCCLRFLLIWEPECLVCLWQREKVCVHLI